MFLKNSLEEKLKRSMSEYQSNSEQTKHKTSQSPNKSQKFRLFNSKTESMKEYLNFPLDHKKFNDEDVPNKARGAKEYVQALIDPDILELQKKRWNISYQPNQNERPELKKTLFEVSHGLRDFKVVQLKEKKVELGTDTRNYCYEGWNGSTLLEQFEKKEIAQFNQETSKLNTIKYWKKNQKKRVADNFVELVEENSKSPKNKLFVKYKNPVSSAIEYNKLLSNVKKQTFDLREKLRKQVAYDNPASTDEKLEALVFKEMFTTYRNEMKYRTGKKKPDKNSTVEELKINENDLIANVAAYLEGFYNNNKNGSQNINNFNSTFPNDEKGSLNYVKDSVNHLGTNPINSLKKFYKKEEDYPLDYETYKKKIDVKKREETIIGNNSENENMNGTFSKYKFEDKKNNFGNFNLPSISKNDFLNNYNNKANNYKRSESNVNKWVKYEYSHPGTYTEFVFKEKKKDNIETQNSNTSFEYVDKRKFSWSCCMNDKRDSTGCKKTVINRLKWNLDSIP